MLHKETVDPKTLDLIRELLADEHLKDFVLVGGTALSLQVGHRISIELIISTDSLVDCFCKRKRSGGVCRSLIYEVCYLLRNDFYVFGFIKKVWEHFETGKEYEAFLIKKKR